MSQKTIKKRKIYFKEIIAKKFIYTFFNQVIKLFECCENS